MDYRRNASEYRDVNFSEVDAWLATEEGRLWSLEKAHSVIAEAADHDPRVSWCIAMLLAYERSESRAQGRVEGMAFSDKLGRMRKPRPKSLLNRVRGWWLRGGQ